MRIAAHWLFRSLEHQLLTSQLVSLYTL